jgi:hypothetical protein
MWHPVLFVWIDAGMLETPLQTKDRLTLELTASFDGQELLLGDLIFAPRNHVRSSVVSEEVASIARNDLDAFGFQITVYHVFHVKPNVVLRGRPARYSRMDRR